MLEEIGGRADAVLAAVQASAHGTSTADLVRDVRGLQQLISALTAAQTVRIAQFAARDEEQREPGGPFTEVDRGVGHVCEFAADTLAPMLGMSHGPATTRVHTAAKLVSSLPLTMRALADAELDPFRAQLIADELVLADRDTCARVEDLIHPEVCGDTPAQVRRRVRRTLADVDPEATAATAARARLERFVRTRASHVPGVTEWWAQLPAEDSVRCWAAIDALAQRRKQDDPSQPIDRCRADALVDLILGNATIEASLTVVVPIATSQQPDGTDDPHAPQESEQADDPDAPQQSDETDDPDAPRQSDEAQEQPAEPAAESTGTATIDDQGAGATGVEIPGIGIVPVAAVLSMAGIFDRPIRRMLVDATTGVTVETSSRSYRPPPGMARYVRLRDGTCRFPGCGVRAERCDLDHVTPWPRGSTRPSNLLTLCRHHHRLKHATRWRVELDPVTAEATWTDPFGDRWVTRPRDHLKLSAA